MAAYGSLEMTTAFYTLWTTYGLVDSDHNGDDYKIYLKFAVFNLQYSAFDLRLLTRCRDSQCQLQSHRLGFYNIGPLAWYSHLTSFDYIIKPSARADSDVTALCQLRCRGMRCRRS